MFLLAAARDITGRQIPNVTVIAAGMAFLACAVTGGVPLAQTGGHLAVGAAAFLVLTLCFALGVMGGGDVKLGAAVMAWAGPDQAFSVLMVVALAGLLIAMIALFAQWAAGVRMLRSVHPLLLPLSAERGVPYGVALALGGVVAAAPGG